MQDRYKTKGQLLEEMAAMRLRIAELKEAIAGGLEVNGLLDCVARNHALLNIMPDLIFRIDKKGVFLDYKAEKEEYLYAAPIDFLGKSVYEVLPGEVARQCMSGIEQALQTGNMQGFEYRLPVNGRMGTYEARVVSYGRGEVLVIVRDFTEQRRMEEALRESENKYRSVFEATGTATSIIDDDMTFLLVNAEFERLSGFSKEEIEGGKKWTEFVVEEDQERLRRYHAMRRNNPGSAPKNYEFRFVDRYGDIKDIFMTTVVIPGTKRSVASLLDITERKQAEDRLRKVEQQQKAILNNIPDIAWLKDRESGFIAANEPFGQACGVSPDDLVGKTDLDIWPKDLAEKYRTDDREVMETGMRKRVEEPLAGKDGERTWIETIKTPIYNHRGEVIGTTGIARDITKRKQAEEALIKSEDNFRRLSQEFNTLLNAIPDALMLISPEMKVLWANSGAFTAFGVNDFVRAGQNCYTLWHGCPAPCENCPAVRSFKSGRQESERVTTPRGRMWDIRSFPIKDGSGAVSTVIVIGADITEKTALQEEAMRADRLASLGELAAGVAHEINNPINGIVNYAQLLVDGGRGGYTGEELARQIIEEGDRIASIVRSLLSFARDMKGERVPVSVGEILYDSLALVEMQLRKEKIALRVGLPPDLPKVMAHAQQIQQVFLNIINNARYALNQKYTSACEEKVLEISGERGRVGSFRYVRVVFRDNGTGIAPDKIDKVVNPFFSTKPGGKGTGLGLSISHGIITDHGGRLMINSIEGEFTSVTVDLVADDEGG